jgi:hypothetical protein
MLVKKQKEIGLKQQKKGGDSIEYQKDLTQIKQLTQDIDE